jgi:transcriptional regulator with XRE-family HTH domain
MKDSTNRSKHFAQYLPEVKSVLSRTELADYADVSHSAVGYWYEGKNSPHRSTLDKIGRLTAVMTFLGEELSFETEDKINFISTLTLDPETYKPTTMLDQIKAGNSSLVVQEAIRLSVVNE